MMAKNSRPISIDAAAIPDAAMANGTEIGFRYDAEGRSDYLNHTASIRAKWAF